MPLRPNSKKFRKLRNLNHASFVIIDNIIHKYNPTSDTLEIDKISYKIWNPITETTYFYNIVDVDSIKVIFERLENFAYTNNFDSSLVVFYLTKPHFYQEISAALSLDPTYKNGFIKQLNKLLLTDENVNKTNDINSKKADSITTVEGLILRNYQFQNFMDKTYDLVFRDWKQLDSDVYNNIDFREYVKESIRIQNRSLTSGTNANDGHQKQIWEFSQKVAKKAKDRLNAELELRRKEYLKEVKRKEKRGLNLFKWFK